MKRLPFFLLLLSGCTAPVHRPVQAPPMPHSVMAPMSPAELTGEYVSLMWEQSPTTNLTGNTVYYRKVTEVQALPLPPATNAIVDRLQSGATYSFWVTASQGTNESDPSNVLDYTVPAPQVRVTVGYGTNVIGPWTTIWSTNYPATNGGFWRTFITRP